MTRCLSVGVATLGWMTLLLTEGASVCAVQAAPAAPDIATPKIRPPAVAGLFYPRSADDLRNTIDRLLASAPTPELDQVTALISPHAGYVYSGPIAARAYRTVSGRDFRTVIILAASHYADFRGVSVPAAVAYDTPLGRVPVSELAAQLAGTPPFVLEPRGSVQRPPWSGQASRPMPAAGEETAETWEHAVEVQVPFLQRTLRQFKILPVVFGRADPVEVARALARVIDERTLVIASTDLSHYHPYAEARQLDDQTVNWICSMDLASLRADQAADRACGRMAVLTLLELARIKGWTPTRLDCRNSGDTAGDKSRVVGYAAIAFSAPAGQGLATPANAAVTTGFSATDREFLLRLARRTIEQATAGGALPDVPANDIPSACRESKGCFVTLTDKGALRGCIGNLVTGGPLYAAVMQNARSAAVRDFRFPPVTPGEVPNLRIEISVLTRPEPLPFDSPESLLRQLQPHRDGVVLKIGRREATFLPQVWEQLPDKAEFLDHLAQKAGCPASAWRGADVSVSIYRVEAFAETK